MADWPRGVGCLILDEAGSTNAEALARGPTATGPLWVMARRQTAGRGRRGRAWASPPGNLAASLVFRPGGSPASAALRSFVMALALRDAFVAVTGDEAAFALKWPNDVLANGAKLAGILLESTGAGGAVDVLVAGVGVNLIDAPPKAALEDGALQATSLLAETGKRISPEDMLSALAAAYAAREAQFSTLGFAATRADWLAHAARLGAPITARLPNETLTGTFADVDETGALVLHTATGPRAIAAGDVFF